MGGRCKDQGSNHHSGKLHRWQAQRPAIRQSICWTAPMAGAHTNILKNNMINCTEGGRKDQQFENQCGQLHGWQAQRTRMQLDPTITLVNCTGGRQSRDPTINRLNYTGGRCGHPDFENQPGKLQGGRRSAETKDLTISSVNCTGGRCRVQGSDSQSPELQRRQVQTPTFWKSAWATARSQAQRQKIWQTIWRTAGGSGRDQGSNHHSSKLHRWQAQRPGIRQSICWTAPAAGADTNMLKINLANCHGAGQKIWPTIW